MPLCTFPGSSNLLRLGEEVTMATRHVSTSGTCRTAPHLVCGSASLGFGSIFFSFDVETRDQDLATTSSR